LHFEFEFYILLFSETIERLYFPQMISSDYLKNIAFLNEDFCKANLDHILILLCQAKTTNFTGNISEWIIRRANEMNSRIITWFRLMIFD